MAYQALYRTYRPRQFSDIVGQEHVVRTLLNSIRQNKLGHAYLFSGPRGTGKTTIARLLARTINCTDRRNGEPCDECERCRGAEEGLGVLEIDAASHGSVDDMRQLVAQISQVPLSGGMMVYIIDEVHMLSKEAFNAFLKTLEEPPPHAVFVLATTEPTKLLATILSRCQHFAFRRIPVDVVAEHIGNICKKENVPADYAALRLIARAGEGSVRDSISVLEQAIAYEPEGLTLQGVRDVLGIPDRLDIRELAGRVLETDPGRVSEAFTNLIGQGREPKEILSELLKHFRDLLFATLDLEHPELEILPEEERGIVNQQAENLDIDWVHRAIAFLAKTESDIKWEDEAALMVEVSLLRLSARLKSSSRPEERPVREKPDIKPAADEFPGAGQRPESIPPAEPDKPGEPRKSLLGGRSLKKSKSRPAETPPEPATPTPAEKPVQTPVRSEVEFHLFIPEDLDKSWTEVLEKIRKNSTADYILLAECRPKPPMSEWTDDRHELLDLNLVFPYEAGLQVKLLREPALLNHITSVLEKAFDRAFEIRVARTRASESGNGSVDEKKNDHTLFEGAARPRPMNPEKARIHDLLIRDFPDYDFVEESDSSE